MLILLQGPGNAPGLKGSLCPLSCCCLFVCLFVLLLLLCPHPISKADIYPVLFIVLVRFYHDSISTRNTSSVM